MSVTGYDCLYNPEISPVSGYSTVRCILLSMSGLFICWQIGRFTVWPNLRMYAHLLFRLFVAMYGRVCNFEINPAFVSDFIRCTLQSIILLLTVRLMPVDFPYGDRKTKCCID
jgi:hypothetical protein